MSQYSDGIFLHPCDTRLLSPAFKVNLDPVALKLFLPNNKLICVQSFYKLNVRDAPFITNKVDRRKQSCYPSNTTFP